MIFYDSFYFLKFNYKKYDIKYKIMIKFILQKYFGTSEGNGDESSNSVESNPKVSQTQTAERADAAQYAIDISLTIFTHSLTYLIKHQLCGLENDSYTKNHLFGIFFCI